MAALTECGGLPPEDIMDWNNGNPVYTMLELVTITAWSGSPEGFWDDAHSFHLESLPGWPGCSCRVDHVQPCVACRPRREALVRRYLHFVMQRALDPAILTA